MPVVEPALPWVGNCVASLQNGLRMGRFAEILSDDPRLYLKGCVLLIPTSAPKAICSVADVFSFVGYKCNKDNPCL